MPCKHEGLNLDPQLLQNESGLVACVCGLRAGRKREAEPGTHGPASLAQLISFRLRESPVSKYKV